MARSSLVRQRLAAVSLLFISIVFNRWTLSAVLSRRIEFSDATKTNIIVVEVLCLAAAVVIWKRPVVRRFVDWLKSRALAQSFVSSSRSKAFWLSIVPICLDSLIRQLTGWSGSEFHWWHPIALLAIAQGMLVSGLFVTGLSAIAYRLTRSYWLPIAIAVTYAVVATVDAAFILYSKMRMSWSLVHASIGATSIYTDPWIIAVGVTFIATSILAVWLTVRTDVATAHPTGLHRLAWVCLLLVSQPAAVVTRLATAPLPANRRASIESHLEEANRFSLNPLLDMGWSLIAAPKGTIVSEYSVADRALQKPFRSSYAVPPFKRPMKRIILVTMESMSMTLTSRYNKELPGVLTPTIDALPASAENVRSISSPTAYGLATHLTSFPNGQAVLNTGHTNALPGYLSQQGWTTQYMQSATLQFQSGERRFREMGYQQLVGRDEAAKKPELARYISDWGLCDRKLYESAVDWLGLNRDRPVFLHILTADTHSPVGRLDWHDLEYPPTPEWIAHSGRAQLYLQAWFRADHDLGLFLAQLRARNLLDDQTAVIVTGDHSCPGGPIYMAVPGAAKESIERIPWILISGRDLPIDTGRLSSQIDTAPTIAQLAGVPSLSTWWGTSLLAKAAGRPQLAWRDRRALKVDPDGTTTVMDPAVQRIGWNIEQATATATNRK
jgi:hypothetical protein